jgi:hypothetical protein
MSKCFTGMMAMSDGRAFQLIRTMRHCAIYTRGYRMNQCEHIEHVKRDIARIYVSTVQYVSS